jgi:prophage antirepressor-like protein
MTTTLQSSTKIAIFEGTEIRRTLYNEEWRFSLEDIVFILTESSDPKQYINKMRNRDEELKKGWVQLVHTLEIQTKGGKQKMNCVNTQ